MRVLGIVGAVVGGIALGGCFDPAPPMGLACGPGDRCPSGQTCIDDVCVADDTGQPPDADPQAPDAGGPPSSDGPPSDPDGDGVADLVDNCPGLANADQHDEDADAIGDACDNCPHLANPTQANAMEGAAADAVGDACDPRPTTGGDTIERFIAFGSAPTDISTLMGPWTVSGDDYVHANTAEAAFLVDGTTDRVIVEIAGVLDSHDPDLWIAITAGEAGNEYFDCGYLEWGSDDPPDFHNAVIERFDGSDFNFIAGNHLLNSRLAGAFTIRMSADSTTDRIACTTSDQRTTATTNHNNASALVPGGVGVRSFGAAFRVRYLIVFGQ